MAAGVLQFSGLEEAVLQHKRFDLNSVPTPVTQTVRQEAGGRHFTFSQAHLGWPSSGVRIMKDSVRLVDEVPPVESFCANEGSSDFPATPALS